MTIHRVAAEGARLEDLDVARRLGQRIWEESDLQLDFSEVEGVTPEFAADRAFDAAEASLDSLPGA